MTDFIRCQFCGCRVYGMQVHDMETCERAQRKVGLPAPPPLEQWPPDPPQAHIIDLDEALKRSLRGKP